MENYFDRLNPNQKEAVITTEGPVLVLAGAGSGKTTVLASRIAYILQNNLAKPWNILAITFTNKAAQEMRSRIERYAGDDVKSMWIGTFHSICSRILRKSISEIDYTGDFVIYDTADSRTVMKECMKELNIDEKAYPPRSVLSVISNAKNDMISCGEFYNEFASNPRMRTVAKLYELYQKKLKQNNALDFDDMIILTVRVLSESDAVREAYQEQFKYILVDEYQDTNNSQYELIRLLVGERENICVVGDDDQSIYKFRGANIENILNFQKDYKGAKKITLDENYRSTSIILNTANAVISNNSKRMGKNLWTGKGNGNKVSMFTGFNEKSEAEYIAREVQKHIKNGGKFSDCAVLYRTNAQSRAIEEAFMPEAIPYKVIAGQRFYDRKEIKDIIAYLRVIYNPDDSVSIERIINEPKRKIGAATIDKIHKHMIEDERSMYGVLLNIGQYDDLKGSAERTGGFINLIEELRGIATEKAVDAVVNAVFSKSGYMAMLEAENTVEAQTRIDNLYEFLSVAREFVSSVETDGSLGQFIENVTLVSDIDDYDSADDSVVLMTVHSAKGLEFPVVFLSGMEEGLFPSSKVAGDKEEIEEERRLCYVAITRAKEKLHMTRALSRFKYGQRLPFEESRFWREVPGEYTEDASGLVMQGRNKLDEMGVVSIMPEKQRMPEYKRQTPPPAVDVYDFKPGDRVRHRKFGDGTVISSQSFGKDAIMVIDFDQAGNKRLMAAFAKLERIGRGDGNGS